MADGARSGIGATNMQKAAAAVGAVFLLVGILGFVPGITTDYDSMEFAGHESDAKLLGDLRGLRAAQPGAPAVRHRRACAWRAAGRPHAPTSSAAG